MPLGRQLLFIKEKAIKIIQTFGGLTRSDKVNKVRFASD